MISELMTQAIVLPTSSMTPHRPQQFAVMKAYNPVSSTVGFALFLAVASAATNYGVASMQFTVRL
jgi:hypothetical protein